MFVKYFLIWYFRVLLFSVINLLFIGTLWRGYVWWSENELYHDRFCCSNWVSLPWNKNRIPFKTLQTFTQGLKLRIVVSFQ